jgi:hypothetical protein
MSEPGNPYDKAARLIIALTASGLILIGGLDVVLEFLRWHIKGGDLDVLKVVINSLVFLAGVVLLALIGRLAARLADYFDD